MKKTEYYKTLEELLKERILFMDGAMGTMIQRYKLEEEDFRGDRFAGHPIDLKGNNDLLCVTRPEIISEIHRLYLEAGADIIETNTFNANSISQADYELESIVPEINISAARLAKETCEKFMQDNPGRKTFVAGALGPTTRAASIRRGCATSVGARRAVRPSTRCAGFGCITFPTTLRPAR